MPIIQNFWNRIIGWFQDRQSRTALVRSFNRSAKDAFVQGIVPIILEAKIVRGEPSYRHQFSKIIEGSGFCIKAYSGRQLTKQEIINIGITILSDETLVRKMVVLGWDTLQIHCDVGHHGCQWQLHDYIMIGG